MPIYNIYDNLSLSIYIHIYIEREREIDIRPLVYICLANFLRTKTLRVEFPGEVPVDLGMSPLETNILIQSNP